MFGLVLVIVETCPEHVKETMFTLAYRKALMCFFKHVLRRDLPLGLLCGAHGDFFCMDAYSVRG